MVRFSTMMTELQETFDKTLEDEFSPAKIALAIIIGKLEKRGIKLGRRLKKDLANQILLAVNDPTFNVIIDDKALVRANPHLPPDYKLNLRLTQRDFASYLLKANKRIDKILPKIVSDASEKVYKIVKRNRRADLDGIASEREEFEKRLNRFWKVPIDALDLFIAVAQQAGADINRLARPTAVEENDLVFEALTRLHARACKTAQEVLTLIKAGFADGAHARWRTIHEIAVISNFIAQQGNDVAEKYLLHQHVVSLKAANQYNQFNRKLGMSKVSAKEIRAQTATVAQLKLRFGNDFGGDYGWAASALGNSNPRFSQLEDSVGFDHLRPYYKMASYNVHAGPKGVYFTLGLKDNKDEVLLAGASNAGFTDPAQGTAISLLQVTSVLLNQKPNVDSLIWMNVLQRMSSDVGEAFLEKQERQDEIDAMLKAKNHHLVPKS